MKLTIASTLLASALASAPSPQFGIKSALNAYEEHAPAIAMSDADHIPLEIMQGGGTLKTWKMPEGTQRAEMAFKTNGRPLSAMVELLIGPIRKTHTINIKNQDGAISPYKACLKFKPGPWTIRITNTGPYEFPMEAGLAVADSVKNEEIEERTLTMFKNADRVLLQGGDSKSKGGQVHSFPIDANVKSVNVIGWSGNLSKIKKGMKIKIEATKGPNEPRQSYDLHCGGSTQPYHCIIQTPGSGWTLRIWSKNVVEYPCEVAVVPHEVDDSVDPTAAVTSPW